MTERVVAGFQGQSFTSRSGSHGPLLDAALEAWPMDAPIRILDVGCGDGDMLFQLARHYRNAILVGVDLSGANVAKANERAAALGLTERCTFRCGDYVAMPIEPVDLVVSHSTLHLIDADPLEVFGKLARDLKTDGVLIASVSRACLFNTLLVAVRWVFRRLRCPATDRLIEALGRRLAGGRLSTEMIRERVAYMYIIPSFQASQDFSRKLARLGMDLEGVLPCPHASIAQMKHQIELYRRR
jgi:ubiquinone/menaquinone biosynthesis C-methylase UbiE